jgi:hypothetical protein
MGTSYWLCSNCDETFIQLEGNKPRCPFCDSSKIIFCFQGDAVETPVEGPLPSGPRFDATVHHLLQICDDVNRAAFEAEKLAEGMSHRNPFSGEEYVDDVKFDAAFFNRRASMVIEMAMVQSLLEEAGLHAFVEAALLRILDLRLGVRIIAKSPSVKTETKE